MTMMMSSKRKTFSVLRSIFMGAPEFALPSLEVVARKTDLLAVYTQPDKPRGRGNKFTPTPVKARALELDLPVHEPKRIRDDEVIAQLKAYAPDVIFVVAYAKLIPQSILDLPKWSCINVHPSLLPRWRGAMPVHAAVMAGDSETGVCTFFMDAGYDTGDIIVCRRTPLGADETGEQLAARMAIMGAEVLGETIDLLDAGNPPRCKQPLEADGGYVKMMTREGAFVRWEQSALEVCNFIRALAHDPGASTVWGEQTLKLGRAQPDPRPSQAAPGTVLASVKGDGFLVATGHGAVLIEEVKPPGKGWMSAWSFLQGSPLAPGFVFGTRPS
jgi:methionyl-tRNA formyltransferase